MVPWLSVPMQLHIVDASTLDMSKFNIVTSPNGRPWLLRERCDILNWPSMMLDFK